MTLSTCVQTRLYNDCSVWSVNLAGEKAFHDDFYSFTHSSNSLFLSVHQLQAFCHLCSLKMKWKTRWIYFRPRQLFCYSHFPTSLFYGCYLEILFFLMSEFHRIWRVHASHLTGTLVKVSCKTENMFLKSTIKFVTPKQFILFLSQLLLASEKILQLFMFISVVNSVTSADHWGVTKSANFPVVSQSIIQPYLC